VLYWTWVFILIAVGVGAFVRAERGWRHLGKERAFDVVGLLILPYPAGWLMALLGAVISSLRFFKAKYQQAHA
jgi:hypothetical protein